MSIIFSILSKYFKEILIIGLIVVILLMRACSGDVVVDPKDIVKVDGKDYELLEQKIDTVFVAMFSSVSASNISTCNDVYPLNTGSTCVLTPSVTLYQT